MDAIKFGGERVLVAHIDCIYHARVEEDPGIVFRIQGSVTIPLKFRNTDARNIFWDELCKNLKNYNFVFIIDMMFKREAVESLDMQLDGENAPCTIISFREGYEFIRPYKDPETMRVEYNQLTDILDKFQHSIASFEPPHTFN